MEPNPRLGILLCLEPYPGGGGAGGGRAGGPPPTYADTHRWAPACHPAGFSVCHLETITFLETSSLGLTFHICDKRGQGGF